MLTIDADTLKGAVNGLSDDSEAQRLLDLTQAAMEAEVEELDESSRRGCERGGDTLGDLAAQQAATPGLARLAGAGYGPLDRDGGSADASERRAGDAGAVAVDGSVDDCAGLAECQKRQ